MSLPLLTCVADRFAAAEGGAVLQLVEDEEEEEEEGVGGEAAKSQRGEAQQGLSADEGGNGGVPSGERGVEVGRGGEGEGEGMMDVPEVERMRGEVEGVGVSMAVTPEGVTVLKEVQRGMEAEEEDEGMMLMEPEVVPPSGASAGVGAAAAAAAAGTPASEGGERGAGLHTPADLGGKYAGHCGAGACQNVFWLYRREMMQAYSYCWLYSAFCHPARCCGC